MPPDLGCLVISLHRRFEGSREGGRGVSSLESGLMLEASHTLRHCTGHSAPRRLLTGRVTCSVPARGWCCARPLNSHSGYIRAFSTRSRKCWWLYRVPHANVVSLHVRIRRLDDVGWELHASRNHVTGRAGRSGRSGSASLSDAKASCS